MAEKPLKSLKFHGLDDIYTIPTGGNIEIEFEGESTGTPSGIDADSLGGTKAEDFATKNFVSSEIAKAKLDESDQNVDLSDYATKDELRLTAEQVGAATLESVNTAKAEVTSYVNEQVKKAAPRNLLDNSDFTNPVNQRGKSNYNSPDYSIDRWKIADNGMSNVVIVNDGHVTISATSGMGWVSQYFEENMLKVGKIYTVAVWLLGGNEPKVGSATIPQIGSFIDITLGDSLQIRLSHNAFEFLLWAGTKDITNVALYEGEFTLETLPEYQSRGYKTELLICRQYDSTTGEYIGLRKFSQPRNLLDNSDFRNPVAQVGFDELHGTDRYMIDRWKRLYDIGTVTKMSDGIKISGGTTECYINQKIDLRGLVGKTLTMAVQTNNEDWKLCGSVVLQENTDAQVFAAENGLYLMTNDGGFTIRVIAGHEYTIKWVALYEGEYTVDTLPEYQPRGYGAELAECQRYFQRISNPCLIGIVTVMDMVNFYCPLCTPLRLCGATEEPTVTFEDYGWINVDGNSITPTGVQDYYKIGYHGLHITLTADGITDLVGTSVPAVLNMPIFIVSCDL